MKKIYILLLLVFGLTTFAQTSSREQFPVFSECEASLSDQQEACFYNTIQNFIYTNYKVPEEVVATNFKGNVIALFEVDTLGKFKILYIDAPYESLKTETKRVFETLPKVKPATYSGRKTYSKFTLKIAIPLEQPNVFSSKTEIVQDKTNFVLIDNKKELTEFEDVAKNYKPFENPQFKSKGNIMFSHQNYGVFDALLNQVGSNNHTASKPYSYDEVAK